MRTRLTSIVAVCAGIGAVLAAPEKAFSFAPDTPSGSGEVSGVVTLIDIEVRDPPMLSPYARRRYSQPAARPGGPSLEQVVVYIVVERSVDQRRSGHATVLQRNRKLTPQVTPIEVGTRVSFPNEDDVFHNLFSLSEPLPLDLGRYAPGDVRSATFDRPGVVRLFCEIHPEMSGTVLVLATPYFAKPDADGVFRIRGVPEGVHTLIAWHESGATTTRTIEVRDYRTTRVNLILTG